MFTNPIHSSSDRTASDGTSIGGSTASPAGSLFLRKSLSLKRPNAHCTLEHFTAAPKSLTKIFARRHSTEDNHRGSLSSAAPVINVPAMETENDQQRHGKISLRSYSESETDMCEGIIALDYLSSSYSFGASPASTLSRSSDPYTVQVVKLSTPTELVFDSLSCVSCAIPDTLSGFPRQDLPTDVDEDLDDILSPFPIQTRRNSTSSFAGREEKSRRTRKSALVHIQAVSELSLNREHALPKRFPDERSDNEAALTRHNSISLFKKRRALGVPTTTGSLPKMRSCSGLQRSTSMRSRSESHRPSNTPSIGSLTLAVSCTHLEAQNEMASRAGALLMANRVRL